MTKCLEINMNKAHLAGVATLKGVSDIVDNLKGSRTTRNARLLCSYTQDHFSGVVLSTGKHGQIESAGKVFLPLDKIQTINGVNIFDPKNPTKIMEVLCDGLDLVDIPEGAK